MSGQPLRSWGLHPPHPQQPMPCHWLGDLPKALARAHAQHGTTLPYGAGRSYGDSCLAVSDHVLSLRHLDRFIHADWEHGVLRAEAGVSLWDVLTLSMSHGWFLPVVPGTSYATLGGAVANDIHGKNHHRRGTFGSHVRRLGLHRSDRGSMECSPVEETELFKATAGGLGLTGVIEWVEVQLMPIASSRLQVITQRFNTLDEFFDLSQSLDEHHEFCVSWIDCSSRGSRLGRGVYMAGDFNDDGDLRPPRRATRSIPFTPPVSLINSTTLKLFNTAYWHCAPGRPVHSLQDCTAFFFPLDGIAHWNRAYGPHGFQQYQALLPPQTARAGVGALLEAIAASGSGSFLAVLKRCGALPSPGLLSFPSEGVTLALDFAQTPGLEAGLFVTLDAIVREAGGRLYPAKDAHMSGEDFRRAYPAWQQVERLRDPALLSRFWKRVIT